MRTCHVAKSDVAAMAARTLWAAILLLIGAMPREAAQAHPHVFITQRLTIVFDAKGLSGFQVHWKFDDMFASMIAEDHDRNHNGAFEPDEVNQVRQEAFSYIKEYNYFSHIKIENKPFRVKFIQNFIAILEDNVLIYEFFIPCHVTATDRFKKITVASYDPSYYSAIFFAKTTPVVLTSTKAFEVKTGVREDPDTKIYYDMVHPWTLFLEFRKKS